jgi:N6-adenosine-specific RNA methylase IME4
MKLLTVGARLERRGGPKRRSGDVRELIVAPRRKHSRQPDQVYEIIEAMYPGLPRIELFARRCRAGWDSWGNQVEPAEAVS